LTDPQLSTPEEKEKNSQQTTHNPELAVSTGYTQRENKKDLL